MTAFLAGGHVLLEDMPGVGKTTLALAFSRVLSLEMKRVQCTPDVMPSDITGFSMYRQDEGEFVFRRGSVFCNLLLADELNRTSPKTQSALLETMEEKQVTVDGETYALPSPFLVIATQNPYGSSGTLPLPLSELDRFMASLSMGYPDFESERKLIMEAGSTSRATEAAGILTAEEFLRAQEGVQQVYVKDTVAEYLLKLITVTRESESSLLRNTLFPGREQMRRRPHGCGKPILRRKKLAKYFLLRLPHSPFYVKITRESGAVLAQAAF